MGWHVLSSTYFDFARFDRESKADTLPHHLLPDIAARLNAEIHQPEEGSSSLFDRMATALYARPEHWALGPPDLSASRRWRCRVHRRLRRRSAARAFVRPEAAANLVRPSPSPDTSRARTKVIGWVLALLSYRLMAVVTTDHQAELVAKSFGRRIAAIHVVEGQTDCRFFRPPEQRTATEPPIVASSGVERRDYHTLGLALADVDVDVKVCFASPNQTSRTRYTMPEPVPANFDFSYLPFPELRALYQEAAVLVLPLLENRYSAGLTTLFEAIACGAPVIVTESPGIIQNLIDDGLVIGVPAGDDRAIAKQVEQNPRLPRPGPRAGRPSP